MILSPRPFHDPDSRGYHHILPPMISQDSNLNSTFPMILIARNLQTTQFLGADLCSMNVVPLEPTQFLGADLCSNIRIVPFGADKFPMACPFFKECFFSLPWKEFLINLLQVFSAWGPKKKRESSPVARYLAPFLPSFSAI